MTDKPDIVVRTNVLSLRYQAMLAGCKLGGAFDHSLHVEYLNLLQEAWPVAAATITALREEVHYANGVCDLAMKHRDAAERQCAALREGLSRYLAAVAALGKDMGYNPNKTASDALGRWTELNNAGIYADALLASTAKQATE